MPKIWAIRLKQRGVGDTVAATYLLRCLHIQYPLHGVLLEGAGAEEIVDCVDNVYEVYNRFPTHWTADYLQTEKGATLIDVDIRAAYDRVAFGGGGSYIDAFREAFVSAARIYLPGLHPSIPYVHLTDVEKSTRPYKEPYWLLFAGYKGDIPLKRYPSSYFKEIVQATPEINWKQVGTSSGGGLQHDQPVIDGAENLVDKTSLRQLINLAYHADGILCGVTLGVPLAQAFQTKLICLMGGRETPELFLDLWHTLATCSNYYANYNLMDNHMYMTTIGGLECCKYTGCAARYPVSVHGGPYPEGMLCKRPISLPVDGGHVGECMYVIRPDAVIENIKKVNTNKAFKIPFYQQQCVTSRKRLDI